MGSVCCESLLVVMLLAWRKPPILQHLKHTWQRSGCSNTYVNKVCLWRFSRFKSILFHLAVVMVRGKWAVLIMSRIAKTMETVAQKAHLFLVLPSLFICLIDLFSSFGQLICESESTKFPHSTIEVMFPFGKSIIDIKLAYWIIHTQRFNLSGFGLLRAVQPSP